MKNILFTVLFSSFIYADIDIQDLDFENSFVVDEVEFIFDSSATKEFTTNPETGRNYVYPNGVLDINYKIKNRKLINKYCDYNDDRYQCSKNKFLISKLKTKLSSLCHENGMQVANIWARKFELFRGEASIQCIVSNDDYVLSNWTVGKSEKDIQINNLSLKLLSLPIYATESCNNKYHFLSFTGPVDGDTKETLKRFMDSVPRCIEKNTKKEIPLKIFMNSGGGYLNDGFEIGRLFRKSNIQAIIPKNAICASSCATAFLGASLRMMQDSSEILFHAPYNLRQLYGISYVQCQENNDSLKDYYEEMLNEVDGNFLYQRTMQYCSSNAGWSLNKDAAELFGLLTTSI